ncbi:unnamed protein product [Tilletia laevis]|nr:hypothetical protein A4X03_0g2304 [Tilletia caries]CAD6916282.1 unnamed protein product [Tilletia laevis]
MSGMNESVRGLSRKVLLISTIHRTLSLLLLLFLIPSIQQSTPFDSSSVFLTVPEPRSVGLHSALEPLIRWDAVHFLRIAHSGYSLEHLFAFQPGLPAVLRIAGAGFSSTTSDWNASQAVLLTSLAAAIAATISPWLLFHLTWKHSASPSLAFLSALLSIFSPAPASLVTPSPEAFFSFFTLLGLVALSPRLPGQAGRPSSAGLTFKFIVAALAFAAATAFRANGILLVGYLAWALWWEADFTAVPVLLRIILSPLALVPALPFLAFQYWAKTLFCDAPDIIAPRPWCEESLPSVYAFVQREYWNVGFLRYWELAQLPNFLLAAPVLVFAVYGSIQYGKHSQVPILRTLLHLPILPSKSDVGSKREGKERSAKTSSASLDDDPLRFSSSPTLLPHMIHNIVIVGLLLFVSHVQIALRFATPGGMPAFWWGLAGWVLKGRRGEEGSGRSTLGLSNIRSRGVFSGLIMWNVLLLALYSGFYPPA